MYFNSGTFNEHEPALKKHILSHQVLLLLLVHLLLLLLLMLYIPYAYSN